MHGVGCFLFGVVLVSYKSSLVSSSHYFCCASRRFDLASHCFDHCSSVRKHKVVIVI
jgi:hypothetical protein